MDRMIKRYMLWTYVGFYIFLFLIGLSMFVLKSQPVAEVLKVLSAWTATFVFVVMFRNIYPQRNLLDFIKNQFCTRIRLSAILAVILLQFLILVGTLFVIQAVWNVPIHEQLSTSWTTLLLVFGYNLILGPLGEELGWSGYVLNELQKSYSPLKSALIVGVTWGFWHAPLWLMSGYSGMQLVLYILFFMMAIISIQIVMTVFYNLNHNLVIPIVIHQLFNYFMAIQTGDQLQILIVTALFYFVVAVGIVFVTRLFKPLKSHLNR
ncbi:CPBP family intramembrane glutamic endopeptidase [Paenibacillus agilis]|uniref:CPBP family intramembrane metalloprotease n=1 Tax=Paenibacillus agilis TaxID=3020863 RepID=A0A559IQ91_9BACL|nr:type II CAAX endopeptidase family protein [Paenibacillus agilis]TVX89760.1 CPBP family intramembrane metalloprotease [Paenibacillus agilis]